MMLASDRIPEASDADRAKRALDAAIALDDELSARQVAEANAAEAMAAATPPTPPPAPPAESTPPPPAGDATVPAGDDTTPQTPGAKGKAAKG